MSLLHFSHLPLTHAGKPVNSQSLSAIHSKQCCFTGSHLESVLEFEHVELDVQLGTHYDLYKLVFELHAIQ